MSDPAYDFTDSALVGHLVSSALLAKLVDRGIIAPKDAADLIDDSLLYLEEYQASFPEYRAAFESARQFLSGLLDGYESSGKIPPA
jgi:hypothetical protein